MKKGLIIILTILLSMAAWVYFSKEPGATAIASKAQSEERIKQDAEATLRIKGERTINRSEAVATKSANEVSEEPQLDCHTRYQKHPHWQEISDIYESFYLSMGEMMGEHHYQQMPLDAVKSYADAGDADAMFHYGSELIWKGGFGIYFNELNRAETLTQEERKERINNHQLNLPMLEQGTGYLVDSAIQGKLGGLIELQLLSHHILKRQMSREANLENTKLALSLNMAYEALLMQVFINDAEVMQGFLFADDREELIQQFLRDYPQQELESIEQEASKIKGRLFGYWQDKRERLGLPIFPDKFPPHLEQHVKDKRRLCDG
ncbi:hypothetical protein GCM10009123_05550 [Kangiella japonica]|uniref:DUF4375 domain-containing protein n=1 Tax=Kangiella japonica TaxID=647384 RepID=A0ABN0SUP9_9GAMM